MAEILSKISIISFVLAALCFLIAVILWFRFKIPVIIGDLTGRNAKKSIARIRSENERTGKKHYAPSYTNKERGKLTEKIKDKQNDTTELLEDNEVTEKLISKSNQKGFFDQNQETMLLDDVGTELLQEEPKEEETTISMQLLEEIMIIHTDEEIEDQKK